MLRKPRETTPPAIGDLSVLPVFLDLKRQRVVVAGDGDGLAWKLELFAAAGAQVHYYSADPTPDASEVAARFASITMYDRLWSTRAFDDARLALGDFTDPAEASAFYTAAKNAGVSCNIVDQPSLCDYQFGSIINRSPVVVSVSTSGAAPILGQAIRQRIESLLPTSLSGWAKAARRNRADVLRRLPDQGARRAFWRRFATAAFVQPVKDAQKFFDDAAPGKAEGRGLVTLVGAGPGDADLLTVKAVRALQAADVILFDDLVYDDVLELARREAKRMLVGKRGGRASCRQDDINELMLRWAEKGRRVVRLKSGDPMIFGRAGEEIAYLEEAGIEVEVVPGITTALAAAAQLGVSLTHRACAQGVKFITAHSRHGELPDIDWRTCADPSTTLIVYMGARTAPALAERLIASGLCPETPVVIGKGISRPDGDTDRCTLGALGEKTIPRDLPVMIGIGSVFAKVQAQVATSSPETFPAQKRFHAAL